jgi:hypothetical protein
MKPIEEMNIEELRQLQRDRYLEASGNGTIAMLWTVVTELGDVKTGSHGNVYTYKVGDIFIYATQVMSYLTVSVGDKKVLSSGDGSQKFIIPGPWIETVRGLEPIATQHKQDRAMQNELLERQKLLGFIQ